MAVNSGRRLPSCGEEENGSANPSSNASAKLSGFWKQLGGMQPSTSSDDERLRRGLDYNIDWLERCLQELEDAHTVDSAIAWHAEAIAELSRHIGAVTFMPWPQELKRNTAFHLMHLRLQLRDGLSNLRMATGR